MKTKKLSEFDVFIKGISDFICIYEKKGITVYLVQFPQSRNLEIDPKPKTVASSTKENQINNAAEIPPHSTPVATSTLPQAVTVLTFFVETLLELELDQEDWE
ncbi:hypothetical protein CUMW_252990 [Citrus unshiu]|uniref:Uncharacterized protein n=1 Tax=Citrus unshiu TaxID=55188 RepID=A0A2H5QQR6_CITUN|nr:hypothetical protein CUMW_252990 [Citrus unshiu]GAY66964.1 hypothetical protein CUMW_252990 [Citrus unshiu]